MDGESGARRRPVAGPGGDPGGRGARPARLEPRAARRERDRPGARPPQVVGRQPVRRARRRRPGAGRRGRVRARAAPGPARGRLPRRRRPRGPVPRRLRALGAGTGRDRAAGRSSATASRSCTWPGATAPLPVRLASAPGVALPVTCTATGKAMLAELPPDELVGRLEPDRSAAHADGQLDQVARALRAELERVRRRRLGDRPGGGDRRRGLPGGSIRTGRPRRRSAARGQLHAARAAGHAGTDRDAGRSAGGSGRSSRSAGPIASTPWPDEAARASRPAVRPSWMSGSSADEAEVTGLGIRQRRDRQPVRGGDRRRRHRRRRRRVGRGHPLLRHRSALRPRALRASVGSCAGRPTRGTTSCCRPRSAACCARRSSTGRRRSCVTDVRCRRAGVRLLAPTACGGRSTRASSGWARSRRRRARARPRRPRGRCARGTRFPTLLALRDEGVISSGRVPA